MEQALRLMLSNTKKECKIKWDEQNKRILSQSILIKLGKNSGLE